MDSYKTIKSSGTGTYTEKRSEFIGVIEKVGSAVEAAAIINAVKSRHHDARHTAFAYYLLGEEKRCSDDGEPQGTAGLPILNVIEQNRIYNCVVTVTRYFGGILLGPGGLTRAYSKAALLALDRAEIAVMTECFDCKLTCSYSFYGRLPSLIAEHSGKITDTVFDDNVTLSFIIPKRCFENLEKNVVELSAGKIKPTCIDGGYAEF